MKKSLFSSSSALVSLILAATVSANAEQEKADLESYSVGERRSKIQQEELKIERPKFENNFKLEKSKPTFGGMKFAKPQPGVIDSPEDPAGSNKPPGPTASADTARPSPVPPAGAETRSVRPLSMDPPTYPRDALRKREQGYVIVEFTINTDGGTEDITIIEAEPRHTFDRQAQRAVTRWRFEPALRDGRPVSQRIRHTIEFTLE